MLSLAKRYGGMQGRKAKIFGQCEPEGVPSMVSQMVFFYELREEDKGVFWVCIQICFQGVSVC